MGCIVFLLLLAFPRISLVLLFLFTSFLERAYHGYLVPLLGFIFLPLTTIVYAWMINSNYPTNGVYLIIIIVAIAALILIIVAVR